MFDFLSPAGSSVFRLSLAYLVQLQQELPVLWGLPINRIVDLFLSENWETHGILLGKSLTGSFHLGVGWFKQNKSAILEKRQDALEYYQRYMSCSLEGHDVIYVGEILGHDATIRTFKCLKAPNFPSSLLNSDTSLTNGI